MKVLVLNSGSSSLKFQLFDMEHEAVVVKGNVEKIGLDGSHISYSPQEGEKIVRQRDVSNHAEAIDLVMSMLMDKKFGVIKSACDIDAIGHRAIHGGTKLIEPVLITADVIKELETVSYMAPLHNPPSILGIKACQEKLPGIPMVAVFDTQFHQTMPMISYLYALPYEYYEKYKVRRYGFHGISHGYVSQRCIELMGKPATSRIISCHMGNGSSVAAIRDGKSWNTSMGFTPLEGMAMGTRAGQIDPSIITFIMQQEGLTSKEMDEILSTKSGLLGISGVSSDMRDIEVAAQAGNERAALACSIFVKDAVHYIGAYAAEMGGVDAIVFTAGIGQNDIAMRARICKQLAFLGLDFDPVANNCRGEEVEISAPGSRLRAFVIPTNEELVIARETVSVLRKTHYYLY